MTTATTRDQLLDHAQALIGSRGCNGFSYRDLADHVGVKTSSVHYYFPCKDDLLLEAVQVYASRVLAAVRGIDNDLPAAQKLGAYIGLLDDVLRDENRYCLGGMMAAEVASLPDPVKTAIQGYFRAMENWLARVLAEGAQQGTLKFAGNAESAGRVLFAALQGSLLSGRLFKSATRLHEVAALFYVNPAAIPTLETAALPV